MKRNASLDVIRLVAMTGVLVDHFIVYFGNGYLNYCGLYLGGG